MTLFADASAVVAILAGEEGWNALLDQLRNDADPIWSALSQWETVAGLTHGHRFTSARAFRETNDFAHALPLRMVDMGQREAALAVSAFGAYGKGRHRARLNMGDCFAYACAKANGAALLYKGDDFTYTDLA